VVVGVGGRPYVTPGSHGCSRSRRSRQQLVVLLLLQAVGAARACSGVLLACGPAAACEAAALAVQLRHAGVALSEHVHAELLLAGGIQATHGTEKRSDQRLRPAGRQEARQAGSKKGRGSVGAAGS
jgi:hypothetical protein